MTCPKNNGIEFIIPQEPRLSWKILLRAFGAHRNSLKLNAQSMYSVFLARNAIYHGLGALGIQPGENILVPAFHCRAAIEPILAYGAEIKFYDVNVDLSPNFHDIRARIDRKSRGILVIQYFGFPQPIKKWRELCSQTGLYLIEDCAHVLTGRAPDGLRLGEVGDISVFSWRKFFPISDGGQLVINNANAKCKITFAKGDSIFRLKMAKNIFDRLLEASSIGRFFSKVLSLLFRAIRHCIAVNGKGLQASKVNSYDLGFDSSAVNLQMTTLSQWVVKSTAISSVVKKRRENYNRLNNAVHKMTEVTPLFSILPDDICPLVFPMVVHGTKNLQGILRAKGIPVTSWAGVIHRALPMESFPNAKFLYSNLLFLPIHQSLGAEDVHTMIRLLQKTLTEAADIESSEQTSKSIDASAWLRRRSAETQ